VALPPEAAFERTLAALQAAGCEITFQAPSTSLKFNKYLQNLSTSGFKVRYTGDLSVGPTTSPGQSIVGLTLQLDGGSAAPVYILYAVVLVFMLWLLGLIGLLITIVGFGYTVWMLGSKTQGDWTRDLLGRIAAAGSVQPQNPAMQPIAPTAGVAPIAPPATAAPGAGAAAATMAASAPEASHPHATDYLDQIKKLAELRDAGALSQEEFDSKKAELLSRV
jgi:hypothetical protein